MRTVRIAEDDGTRARFVSAVHEGLADADAGRLTDHDQVVSQMRSRAKRRNAR